jgi:hypothetical protein
MIYVSDTITLPGVAGARFVVYPFSLPESRRIIEQIKPVMRILGD